MSTIERQAMQAAAKVIREALEIGEELRQVGRGFTLTDPWGRDAADLAAELERRADGVDMSPAAARRG